MSGGAEGALRRLCYENLREQGVPTVHHRALVAYLVDHEPLGPMLHALVSNDLKGFVTYADELSRQSLHAYIHFLDICASPGCWGSVQAVEGWLLLGKVRKLAQGKLDGTHEVQP